MEHIGAVDLLGLEWTADAAVQKFDEDAFAKGLLSGDLTKTFNAVSDVLIHLTAMFTAINNSRSGGLKP